MNKKEEFKLFASKHPELLTKIQNGEMSWQKYYEIYDIYGEDDNVWKKYTTREESKDTLSKLIQNIDMESIQNHINTAQKALSFISELTTKNPSQTPIDKGPQTPRPLGKFFAD